MAIELAVGEYLANSLRVSVKVSIVDDGCLPSLVSHVIHRHPVLRLEVG